MSFELPSHTEVRRMTPEQYYACIDRITSVRQLTRGEKKIAKESIRRVKNRQYASQSRKVRKVHTRELELRVEELERELGMLVAHTRRLEQENLHLISLIPLSQPFCHRLDTSDSDEMMSC